MRRFFLMAGLMGLAAGLPVSGAALHPEIDLAKFDDDLMRTLDKTIKYFEPDVTAGNVEGATDDAEILQDGLKWLEDYFAHKGPTADHAVQLARHGQESLALAMKAVANKDFAAAATAAREVTGNCKACHEEYRPEKAR